MLCENCFCIYWSESGCILDDIDLDIQGKCNCCIYVDINEDTLKELRETQLSKSEHNDMM